MAEFTEGKFIAQNNRERAFRGLGTPPPAETLQETFGLPPDNILPETTRKIKDSMPTCHFIPSQPVFKFGLDLFSLKNAFDSSNNTDPSYKQLLESHGFKTENTAGQGIKVAYLADNFPTDTFTNEYGENFLQNLGDVASSGAAQISQFFGVKNASEALGKIAGAAKQSIPTFEVAGKKIDIAGGMGALAQGMGRTASRLFEATGTTNAANMIGRLMAGARLDFPMVWKSSGFQPSYSLTVRLYNPNPRSVESTKKYIVGPVVAILLLGVPISQDGSTYSWPYLHKIVSPGIFELNPGFIQNITVIKGGDQQQISQQQHLAMVDVRIDIGSLYSSMVAGSTLNEKTRPTIRKYMNSMLQQGDSAPSRHIVYDRKGQIIGDEAYKFQKSLDTISKQTGRANVYSRNQAQNKQPTRDQSPTKEQSAQQANDRVNPNAKTASEALRSQTPTGYGFRATDEEQ